MTSNGLAHVTVPGGAPSRPQHGLTALTAVRRLPGANHAATIMTSAAAAATAELIGAALAGGP